MSEFIEKLRDNAVYFKLTSKSKFGEAVSVIDVYQTLKNLSDSYKAFVDAKYSKLNTVQDTKRLKQILNGLEDENQLMVVNLKFESYGMAISPNTITNNVNIPSIKNQLDWKKQVFDEYQTDVLKADFNSTVFLEKIEHDFNPIERNKIFKPIVDGIANNNNSVVQFGIGKPEYDFKIQKPSTKNYERIFPNVDFIKLIEQEEIKTSVAKVGVRNGKVINKTIELFDDITNIVMPFKSIVYKNNVYNLKHKIYCELLHEDNMYLLENEQLCIYVNGETKEEAKQNFCEEFDYIYRRYNSLSNDMLTNEVINIKDFLNSIVEK